MRSAPTAFSPDAQVGTILAQTRNGGFDAWPIVGKDGLRGMIRNSEIEQLAAEGGADSQLSEILGGNSEDGHSVGGTVLHVHPDHSLSLAMERMGAGRVNVLPVVSRANVHQLVGIVALEDILNTYGVGKRNSIVEPGE
jgi:CBS domain-containing protein